MSISSTTPLSPGTAVRAAGIAGIAAIVANLLVYGVARVLGADFVVVRPGGAEMSVGATVVIITTVAPLVLGAVALAVAGRWDARGWMAVAWIGLALGVLTVVMPLGIEASAGTKAGLAAMHVLTGVSWFAVVRQTVRRERG